MSPTAYGWNEDKLSETPAVNLLEDLGYTYVDPETLEAERSTLKEAILERRVADALKKLNPWMSSENVAKVIKQVVNVPAVSLTEANQALYNHLTYGMSIEQDLGEGRKGQTVAFFNFEDPSANEFIVTKQYRVHGTKHHVKPDIVCFVNGIPLVVIECKSPTKGDQWRQEAIKQLRRYQEADDEWRGEGAPRLFETVQIVIGTCGQAACYGTVGTPGRFFFEWKEGYPKETKALQAQIGRKPTPQDVLLYSTLRPANLLDLVKNFIVFDTEGGRKVKKLCRYKQFIAVNKAIDRMVAAKTADDRGGVVWHTQGSGKSLTMLWLALKLRRDPRLENPTLVIVTDRTALDKQISDTFVACGFPNPERAKTVRDLRKLLRNATGKTITTTIQKFQEVASGIQTKDTRVASEKHPLLTDAANVVVMVDEAHRSQYRGLAANMRHAMPNACFFGFTGTPIDKKDKSTLQTFGPYIDTYTIEQAVQDGATVPIFYESRLPELRILGQSLDKLFDHMFPNLSDEDKAAIRKKYANEEAIAGAPHRIKAISLDILEHFRQYIQPNGFKAQVVAVNRDAAVAYKETLDDLNGPESALIFSAAHNDKEHLAKWHLKRQDQDKLVERFKRKDDPLSILIVCDMLLTGFDAPIEQVMYLDSPLREHNLLQAIARTNRKYDESKTYGLIVDYWGVSDALKDALAVFSSEDVEGALEPKADELPRLQSRHQAALRFFHDVKNKNDLDSCVAALEDADVRHKFEAGFRKFAQSLDMLYPDPKALAFVDDARWLGKIRQASRARYRDGKPDYSEYGAKVRKLIEEAVVADGIQLLVKEVSLFSKDFETKIDSLKSNEAKASEMEHAVRHEIHVKLEQNPAFYQSLRERLEEIITERKAKRIDAAEQLSLLQGLIEQMHTGAKESADDLDLSESGYAIYGLLEQARPSRAEDAGDDGYSANRDLASLIDDAIEPFTKLVDWHKKDDIQREIRRKVKRQLRAAGVPNVDALAGKLVDLAKARRST
ncbi:MAG: type I restriction endonuclease subunit R [Nannocystaceae bacterium]|nr:type I restriction endonuclease subunit R [bacterium]